MGWATNKSPPPLGRDVKETGIIGFYSPRLRKEKKTQSVVILIRRYINPGCLAQTHSLQNQAKLKLCLKKRVFRYFKLQHAHGTEDNTTSTHVLSVHKRTSIISSSKSSRFATFSSLEKGAFKKCFRWRHLVDSS